MTDFAFPLLSPLSVRHPRDVPADETIRELRAEIADRAQLYPRLVEKGRLTAEAAERHVAILHQLLAELDYPLRERLAAPARHLVFSWAECVAELRRELAIRRAAYPGWIAKARLAAAAAARKSEAMDALHYRLWIDGACTDDPRLTAPVPRREDFEPGLAGDWRYATALVDRNVSRNGFFAERYEWLLDRRAAADPAVPPISDENADYMASFLAEHHARIARCQADRPREAV